MKKRNVGRDSWIAPQQLGVPGLELAQMLLLLEREILEHLSPARILGHTGGAAIEVEPAALGGNRDAERVTREHEIRVAAFERRGTAGAALLARAVDLHHALRGGKASRRRHFLDKPFDVGAEELEGPVTGLANEVEVTRLTVRMLEPEAALAEVDLARDAGVDHPLQRAVDGRAADAMIVLADQIDEIVGAEMAFLTQEHIDNLLPLAGALASCRRQSAEIREGTHNVALTFP